LVKFEVTLIQTIYQSTRLSFLNTLWNLQ